MNILILGGNGYIGSKVTREFVNSGHSVVCTKRPASNLFRLQDIQERIRWIPASVYGVEAAMQYMSFDYVLNMACNYGRSNVLYDDVIHANIEFPLKVLNTVVEHGAKNYLTIGTGLPNEMNMYSFSKKMFSEFGRFYVEKHGICFSSLLLEMFYGADEPQNRFLPSIITKMIKGEEVNTTIGTQRRDIIDARDIVKAVFMVVESDIIGYNEIPVGTGVAPTISEIVDYIWEKTGRKSKVNKGAIPVRRDEPDCVADISAISNLGAWHPTPWKEGLENMVNSMFKTFLGGGGVKVIIIFCCGIPLRGGEQHEDSNYHRSIRFYRKLVCAGVTGSSL